MSEIRKFTGLGTSGDWNDPANWNGDKAASQSAFAVIPVSTTMNGAFTARVLMMLGDETVTVNGAITTLSPQFCLSFMVCNGATAIFTPTSSLNDAGGIVVGSDAHGTMFVQGDATARSAITTVSAKMGLHAGGTGYASVDGGIWNNSQNMYVGLGGNGTLMVDQGGQVNVGGNFLMAAKTTAQGTASISGGGHINVTGLAAIGGGLPVVGQGVASLTIGAGGSLDVGKTLSVSPHGVLTMAGGNVAVHGAGITIQSGGVIAGNGAITTAGLINDAGTITASGGTLTLGGDIEGKGVLQINDGSTAVLSAGTIGKITMQFAGTSGTLDLAHGVIDHGTIAGFTAGDSLIMAGIDQIGWNGSTDMLTLSQAGTVVDTLQFTGDYSAGAFHLTQTDAGGVITWNAIPTH